MREMECEGGGCECVKDRVCIYMCERAREEGGVGWGGGGAEAF